jgi:hemerythrin-like domain-containing protein
MPDTILLLQLEHDRVAKLLDLVAQQLANLVRHHPVNYRLLQNAFDYLSDYPDQCHHPKEDLVYRKLRSRHPDMVKSLSTLVEEHERLAHLTASLRRTLRESQQEKAGTNDWFAKQLREFLEFYRHHMAMEERHFFPAALQSLSRNDWAEIDFTVFDQPDPLLDRSTEDRFAKLRDEITRLGQAQMTSAAHREEAACLGRLHDIADFNEAMQQSGESVRLNRSSEGGYELERGGSVLVHIPECSESRAVWCAYFFLKSHTRFSLLPWAASFPD